MHAELNPILPIYDSNGELSFKMLNELIGASNEVTAGILGVSEGTIRSRIVSHATLRKSQPLIHILNMLWKLTDGKQGEAKRWLYEPRPAWGGRCPMDLLMNGNSEAVAGYLEGLLDGEALGS